MERNMGSLDRLFRAFVVGPALIVLSLVVFVAWSVLGIAALVVAGVMLVTAAVRFCPGYTPFGVSTRSGFSTRGRTGIA